MVMPAAEVVFLSLPVFGSSSPFWYARFSPGVIRMGLTALLPTRFLPLFLSLKFSLGWE